MCSLLALNCTREIQLRDSDKQLRVFALEAYILKEQLEVTT